MKFLQNIIAYVLVAVMIEGCVYGCNKITASFTDATEPLYTTTGSFRDSELHEYKTVTLGGREWMADNLMVTRFQDGSAITEAKSQEDWTSAFERREPAWTWIAFDPKEGQKYGRLYNWYAVTDPRGLAPEGWVVPDSTDWMDLVRSARLDATICMDDDTDLDGDYDAGVLQKPDVDWNNPDLFGVDTNGDGMSGFNAVPGGMIGTDGIPGSLEMETAWWGKDGLIMRIGNHSHGASHEAIAFYQEKNTPTGCYIRCVRSRGTSASLR